MPIRYLPHTRFGRQRRVTDGYPVVIDDGNSMLWVDYLENITKDGSNLVSVWGDKSGNGNDLLQATGTNQPIVNTNGVLFDGVDNFMKAAAFTLVQPEQIYIVFKQVTWTLYDTIFDGNTLDTGRVLQRQNTPELMCIAGSNSPVNNNLSTNTYAIARILFNGVSSSLQINKTTAITDDFGLNNMNGFTIGARGQDDYFGNIEVKEIIIRKVADSASDESDIYDYLANKYSI